MSEKGIRGAVKCDLNHGRNKDDPVRSSRGVKQEKRE